MAHDSVNNFNHDVSKTKLLSFILMENVYMQTSSGVSAAGRRYLWDLTLFEVDNQRKL